MSMPAAKQGDRIVAVDVHLIQPPGPTSPVPVPHPFSGPLSGGLSATVFIEGKAAATVGSTAQNTPRHVPIGGSFVVPPPDRGEVAKGSTTVWVNGKAAARAGDPATSCDDPVPMATGSVVATSTVFIGG